MKSMSLYVLACLPLLAVSLLPLLPSPAASPTLFADIDCGGDASGDDGWNMGPIIPRCEDDKIRDPVCMDICEDAYHDALTARHNAYCGALEDAEEAREDGIEQCGCDYPNPSQEYTDCINGVDLAWLGDLADAWSAKESSYTAARQAYNGCAGACDCIDP